MTLRVDYVIIFTMEIEILAEKFEISRNSFWNYFIILINKLYSIIIDMLTKMSDSL